MCVYISFFKFYPHSPVKKKNNKTCFKGLCNNLYSKCVFFRIYTYIPSMKTFFIFWTRFGCIKNFVVFSNFYYPRDIRNSKKIHYSNEVFSKICDEQIHKGQILKCGFNNLQTTLNNYKQMLTIVFLFMYIFYLYL